MSSKFFILIAFCLVSCCKTDEYDDSKIEVLPFYQEDTSIIVDTTCIQYTIFKNQLKIIEGAVKHDGQDSSLSRVAAISFLEDMTGVISKCAPNYVGKLEPSIDEYNAWNEWFIANQKEFCSDEFRTRFDTVFFKTYPMELVYPSEVEYTKWKESIRKYVKNVDRLT